MKPPATDPPSIAAPPIAWPRANTDSRSSRYPWWWSASTSQASTAPEKKVKPRPIRAEAIAQPQNGAAVCHIHRYSRVETSSVSAPSRYDTRRPRVSAITPVGISNTTWPAVKNALAANAWVLLSPASSRNRVLIPQISEADSVASRVSSR